MAVDLVTRVTELETELAEVKDALRALENLLRERRLLGKDDRFVNGAGS